jgi:hypothetical protein
MTASPMSMNPLAMMPSTIKAAMRAPSTKTYFVKRARY